MLLGFEVVLVFKSRFQSLAIQAFREKSVCELISSFFTAFEVRINHLKGCLTKPRLRLDENSPFIT
jgi:hypothetical protein